MASSIKMENYQPMFTSNLLFKLINTTEVCSDFLNTLYGQWCQVHRKFL